MKLKPSLLFLLIAIFALLIGLWTKGQAIDINIHDTYYIVGHLYVAVVLSLFTGLTGLIYLGLEKIKRPIKLKTGYWHFGVFIAGILILVLSFGLKILPESPFLASMFVLAGILLLFLSLFIFVFGLVRAFFYRK